VRNYLLRFLEATIAAPAAMIVGMIANATPPLGTFVVAGAEVATVVVVVAAVVVAAVVVDAAVVVEGGEVCP